MSLRLATKSLLGIVLGLPLLHAILAWVSALLGAMGDDGGAAVVGRVGLGIGILWLASLAALVIVLALRSLDEREDA
jgi:hypothetical protein